MVAMKFAGFDLLAAGLACVRLGELALMDRVPEFQPCSVFLRVTLSVATRAL
jgi:hypothetical protein